MRFLGLVGGILGLLMRFIGKVKRWSRRSKLSFMERVAVVFTIPSLGDRGTAVTANT